MWDADLGVPRRVRPLPDEGSSARQLRMFTDTFVTEEFLPDIYVDFRRASVPMIPSTDSKHASS